MVRLFAAVLMFVSALGALWLYIDSGRWVFAAWAITAALSAGLQAFLIRRGSQSGTL